MVADVESRGPRLVGAALIYLDHLRLMLARDENQGRPRGNQEEKEKRDEKRQIPRRRFGLLGVFASGRVFD